MNLSRTIKKNRDIKSTYKLSFTGSFKLLDSSEPTRNFKLSIELFEIYPSEIYFDYIWNFVPSYLINSKYLEFKCKIYDNNNNTFKVFCYQNGHYAKLVNGVEVPLSDLEMHGPIMSQEEIDDFFNNLEFE